MLKTSKTQVAKCLIATMTLIPVAKMTNAKENPNYRALYSDQFTFTVKAGPTFVLPSQIVNNQIGGTDMEGFNGGAHIETGFSKWQGEQGASGNTETHFELSARFDYLNVNSRAQSMYAADNAHYLATGEHCALDSKDFGCANITDLMWTLNAGFGIGGSGITWDTKIGCGWHMDNHGNYGPVLLAGFGLGARVTRQMKLVARYSLYSFPYDNFNSYTNPRTSVPLRHLVEVGFMYKLKTKEAKTNYAQSRARHR